MTDTESKEVTPTVITPPRAFVAEGVSNYTMAQWVVDYGASVTRRNERRSRLSRLVSRLAVFRS